MHILPPVTAEGYDGPPSPEVCQIVWFYDAHDFIRDVIITKNPHPYATKFLFVDLRINTDKDVER